MEWAYTRSRAIAFGVGLVLGAGSALSAAADEPNLRGLAHGRGIDHGHRLFEVLREHAIEQRLVLILQGSEADVPADGVLVEEDRLEEACGLAIDIFVLRRQQRLDAELSALLGTEARPLVQQRITQQFRSGLVDDHRVAVGAADQFEVFHGAVDAIRSAKRE